MSNPKTASQIAVLLKRSDSYVRTTLSTHHDAPNPIGGEPKGGGKHSGRLWDFDEAAAFFARHEARPYGRHKPKIAPEDLPDEPDDDLPDEPEEEPAEKHATKFKSISDQFLKLLADERARARP